jgi:hypothetical protein
MYLLGFGSLSLHDKESDGDGTTAKWASATVLAHFGCMRVARRDHMVLGPRPHVSPNGTGRGVSLPSTAVRGVPTNNCGIDLGGCEGYRSSHYNMLGIRF